MERIEIVTIGKEAMIQLEKVSRFIRALPVTSNEYQAWETEAKNGIKLMIALALKPIVTGNDNDATEKMPKKEKKKRKKK